MRQVEFLVGLVGKVCDWWREDFYILILGG